MATQQTHASKVREWAKANGHAVGERGRIHPTLLRKYAAAHRVVPTQVTVDDIDMNTAKVGDYTCGWCSFGKECERCRTTIDEKGTLCRCAANGHK